MEKKTIWDLDRVSVDEYKSQVEKLPIAVVLDNIRSLNNVGCFVASRQHLQAMKYTKRLLEPKTRLNGNTMNRHSIALSS